MAKFVWLASYPKSGNTWIRFLIATLIRGEIKSSQDVAVQIPDIHEGLHGVHLIGKRTTILKTHWKFWTEMPLREDTVGAVYIVRNPIAVMESNQNFAFLRSGSLRKEASDHEIAKAASKFVDDFIEHGGHARFRQFGIGTWEENVRSWTWPDISFPRLVVRYEDLKAKPEETLGKLAGFLSIKRTEAQIAAAIAACSKARMKALEEQEIAARSQGIFYQERNRQNIMAGHRFVDRSIDGKGFFKLTPDQRLRAITRFAPLMQAFGYLPRSAVMAPIGNKENGARRGRVIRVERPSGAE